MSEIPDSLPETAAWQIKQSCKRFQADWKAGRKPLIETYVDPMAEPERSVLLESLLKIEINLLSREGMVPSAESYGKRFPQDADLVSSVARTAELDSSFLEGTNSFVSSSTETSGRERTEDGKSHPTKLGRYEILEVLGEGAFGIVFRARDPQLDRTVAVKVPHAETLKSAEDIERFLREARAAGTINHPNICPVYDVGKVEETYYIVMAYIAGRPLSSFIEHSYEEKKSGISKRHAVRAIRKLALALHAAHRKGVIHRDLKPANVMIDRERREPIIMDFGLARRSNTTDTELTDQGQVLGTPAYMSPEQARGDIGLIGPQSDVYNLGVMLYELLCGEMPFEGPHVVLLAQILQVEPKPPSVHRVEIEPSLDAICLKALAKKLDDRYRSMREFAADLTAYLQSRRQAGLMASGQVASPGRSQRAPAKNNSADSDNSAADAIDLAQAMLPDELESALMSGDAIPIFTGDPPISAAELPVFDGNAAKPVEPAMAERGGDGVQPADAFEDVSAILNDLESVPAGTKNVSDEEAVDGDASTVIDVEQERREQERREQERREQERREQERQEQERQEQERLERERLERLKKERREKEQRERLERERRDKERQERLEQTRLEQERLKKERLEQERLEQERLEQERLEQERLEQERLDQERLERERLERERLKRERLEQERLEQERLEQERLEQERLEQERLEQERLEQERLEQEREEEARQKVERRAAAWVLEMGGTVSINADGRARSIRFADELPTTPLQIVGVNLARKPSVDDAGLANLSGLQSVRRLAFSGADITDAGMACFAGFSRLEVLHLGGTKVTDMGLVHLHNLTAIQSLHLNDTQVTDRGLLHLQRLPKLEGLYLNGTSVTDAGIEQIGVLKRLCYLAVKGSQISAEGIAALKRKLPNCEIH